MFLADWSGRRVAAYAITWLVGFPVLMTAALVIGAWKAAERPPEPREIRHAAAPHGDTAWVNTTVVVDTAMLAAHHRRSDPSGRLVYLPMQQSDVVVAVGPEGGGSPFPDVELLPWLLPPALLVAAWGWTRRSRPDAG